MFLSYFRGTQGTEFLYMEDFSGDMTVRSTADRNENRGQMRVPLEDVKEFIAHCIKGKKLKELKNATTDELLGM